MTNDPFENYTDNESNDSSIYSDTENEYYYEYDPEEISITKYNIVLAEKYNNYYHGYTDSEVNSHYLVLYRLKIFDYNQINNIYGDIINYRSSNYEIKPDIAECIYLSSGHCIGIIKTFWIRIIQRTWKNILNKRKQVMNIRKNLYSLRYREINGKWPNNCIEYPQLKGMLSYLSRTSS